MTLRKGHASFDTTVGFVRKLILIKAVHKTWNGAAALGPMAAFLKSWYWLFD